MNKTLMLHRVLPKHCADGYYYRRGTAIDIDCFRRMLDALERNHWQTVTPLEKNNGARQVCLTFDDGYADNALALDELLTRDMRATVFAVKNYCTDNFSPIDDMAAWLDDRPDVSPKLAASLVHGRIKRQLRGMSAQRYRHLRRRHFALGDHPNAAQFLTEQQLRDYCARGIAIGIHGCTHRVWSCLSTLQLRTEIEHAARWLRALGVRDIAGLCFPHGQYCSWRNLSSEITQLAEVGLFGVDEKYTDPAVTHRIWIRQNTNFSALFVSDTN